MRSKTSVTVILLAMSLLALALPADAADPDPYTLSQSHAAGDWVILYVPLAEPTTEHRSARSFEVTATAPEDTDGNLLVFALELLWDRATLPSWPFESPTHQTVPAGETVTVEHSRNGGASISGGEWVGFAMAVASDVPWTLDVTIDPADGYVGLGTPMINSGTGTTVRTGEELLELPVDMVDQIRYEGTFASAGWHHVHLDVDLFQPNSVRDYEIVLPTAQWSGTSTMRGYHVPFVGGSAGSSGKIDMAGSYQDTAGDFQVSIDYVETSFDVDLYIYEMPGAVTLPTGWDAAYQQSHWPFP